MKRTALTITAFVALFVMYAARPVVTTATQPLESSIPTTENEVTPTVTRTTTPKRFLSVTPRITIPDRLLSRMPTIDPSRKPSPRPTRDPSTFPTRFPTLNISRFPTINPSLIPTRVPRATIAARVCERVTSALDKRIEQYQQAKDKRSDVISRLHNLITLAQSKGVDTTELEAALPALQQRVDKLTTDVDQLVTLLQDAKNADCNATDGSFDAKLESARAQLLVIRNDLNEIRTYYHDSISPLLADLRTQLEATITPTTTL
ncbi:hypothetical protein HGA91_03710 [candidate division WWE3 bacterium]|nr:hypothetical protein [candidate division WWE3 bacterium]